MNILFINDTTISRHPGSTATVQGIYNMLTTKKTNIYSLPVGYGYPILAECRGDFNKEKGLSKAPRLSLVKAKSLIKKINHLYTKETSNNSLTNTTNIKEFSADAWYSTIDQLNKEPFFDNILQWSDAVIINGEGTIHHNYYGAQTLLALAAIATERKKPTMLINSTIESIDEILIKESLSKISYISVRDNYSKMYLESHLIKCSLHPDAAFSNKYSKFPINHTIPPKEKPSCLISAGIEKSTHLASNLIKIAKRNGYEPVYCCLDSADDSAYRYCRDNNIKIIHYATIPWWFYPDFLNQFDLCISGRHHLNVFCILGKTPFIPLNSNTWKIQGTLDLINYPLIISNNLDEIEHYVQTISKTPTLYNDSLIEKTIEKSRRMISDYLQ